jgi:LysM repeat protein
MTPKTPDFKNVDGNVIRTQFVSNQFKLPSPNPSWPATATAPKIPSFLTPSKQHSQDYVPTPNSTNSIKIQTKPILAPISIVKSSPNLAVKQITEVNKFSNPVNSLAYSDKPPIKFTPPEPIPDSNSTEESLKLQTYKTQTGDTYWSVSEKAYQDGRYFRALFRYNQSMHADYELVPGLELIAPAKGVLEELWPEECPIAAKSMTTATTKGSGGSTTHHVTSNGDTLFEIARQKLNQASRFVELYQLNTDKIGNDVQPDSPLPGGLKLTLPN